MSGFSKEQNRTPFKDKSFQTIEVSMDRMVLRIQMIRDTAKNSINIQFLEEITWVFKQIVSNTSCKVILLKGNSDYFCTGLDFQSISTDNIEKNPYLYFDLLQLFSTSPQIVISQVEGAVKAGGIGLIAASDIVVAGARATFSLSEALFGILPACVMPFLIRRIGHQKAKLMTLMTTNISSNRAYELGLVDELGNNNCKELVRKLVLRLSKLETSVIQHIKSYTNEFYIIDDDDRKIATDTLIKLLKSKKVQQNMDNYINGGVLPWNK